MPTLRNTIWITLLMGLLFSCKKEDHEPFPYPNVPNTPHIALNSVNQTSVVANQDSLVFVISYMDGNGDIGHDNADSTSLRLTDNRGPLVMEYHIPPVTPDGNDISVRGEFSIVLQHTILFDQSVAEETVTFTIQLKDRAGNWSNAVTSPVIKVGM